MTRLERVCTDQEQFASIRPSQIIRVPSFSLRKLARCCTVPCIVHRADRPQMVNPGTWSHLFRLLVQERTSLSSDSRRHSHDSRFKKD
jgi:hypothetical protein